MELNEAKHQAKLEEWRAKVYDCRNSGIPVRQWCLERDISFSTYYRWQRAVWKSERVQAAFQEMANEQNNGLQIAEITLPAVVEQNQQETTIKPFNHATENCPTVQQSREQPIAVIRKGKLSCEIRNGIDPEILRQIMRLVNSCD